MKLIITFKDDADLLRVAEYLSNLPKAAPYKDVIETIELPEPDI